MTETNSYAPRLTSLPRAQSNTIYRDTLLTAAGSPPSRPTRSSIRALVAPDERISGGILIALAAVTLPAAIYSLAQLLNLIAGGSLEQAVRAFGG